jgi:large subunit ribosomal protein L15
MLHSISPNPHSRKKRKRVARGNSAGGGTTGGRGTKGQQSRVGKGRKHGFEGGQVPLIVRQPKLGGFKRPRRKEFEAINIGLLEEKLEAGSYDVAALREAGIVQSNRKVKILGEGKLSKKFALTVDAASEGAKKALEKAGGSVTVSR